MPHLKKFLSILLILIISACSLPTSFMPDNNIVDSKGFVKRGYKIVEFSSGHFSISYKGPALTILDPYKSAWKMVSLKSEELCGTQQFVLRNKTEERIAESIGGWSHYVSANLICDIQNEDQYLVFEKARQRHLEKQLQQDHPELFLLAKNNPCSDAKSQQPFTLAKDFYSKAFYKEAMICFLKSINQQKHVSQSNHYIGMMYEFGYGVEKNIDIAMKWYEK